MNNKKIDEKNCDKPEILAKYPKGCPKEQQEKCHGMKSEKK